jgi:hypothetical protein
MSKADNIYDQFLLLRCQQQDAGALEILIERWQKWLVVALWLFCIYQFFHQEEIMAMITYASGAIMCSVVIARIAGFFFQEVNKSIFNREIKRLELQVALLIKHI